MPDLILQTDNLSKSFDDIHAVRDITFGIRRGEIFSLLGPNGAGKTTTISMLSCLITPTAGDATINGHSIRDEPQQVKEVIGVVPQEIALYQTLSARENLLFWGQMYGMGGKSLQQRIDELLHTVGLAERANDRIEAFSGGMKRRINIAVGLLHSPQLVFMDEPTVGIDPQSRRNILDMVKELNRQGMTVLYTTHYMEEAQELSDRIGIIDHGELIALGPLHELTELVGQEDILELQFGSDAVPPTLIQAFQALPGVRHVSLDGGDGAGQSDAGQSDAAASDSAASDGAEDDVLRQPPGGLLRLFVADGHAALPAVIAAANAQQAPISSISVQEPNLEAVFLHLTGRALRD